MSTTLPTDDNLIQQALSYALEHLVKARPNNPVEFVAQRLLEFQRTKSSTGGATGASGASGAGGGLPGPLKRVGFGAVHDEHQVRGNTPRATPRSDQGEMGENGEFEEPQEDEYEDEYDLDDEDGEDEAGSEDGQGEGSGEDDGKDDEEEEDEGPKMPVGQVFMRGRRHSVSAETFSKMFAYPDDEEGKKRAAVPAKSAEQEASIRAAIGKNFMFKNLDEDQMSAVIKAMVEVKKAEGSKIITQGDEGDYFYVLAKGQCEVWVSKNRQPAVLVKTAEPGDSFGELALMYFCPRAATVVAKTDCVLWAVDRAVFRTILMETTLRKRQLYESFLDRVEILGALNPYERATLADALEASTYGPEEVIIRQGDSGDKFYIIEQGSAYAIMDKKAKGARVDDVTKGEIVREDYGPGDYFGEISLLNDQPRACSVITREKTKVLSLERQSFSRLLGSCEKILRRNVDLYQSYSKAIADRHAELKEAKRLKDEFKAKT